MVKAYNRFKDQNFTILSVSMDKSRKSWLEAVQADGLFWQQLCSLGPQNAESAQNFGVTSIPRNFLIDPKGKIIAMDLRGHELQDKLFELFK